MLNTIIGVSLFGLPSLLAGYLGSFSPLAYLVAGAGIATVAICLAEVSSQFRHAGGPYLYARAAFGSFVAIQVGWFTWLTRIVSCAAGTNLFVAYLGRFFPIVENGIWRIMVAGLLILALALVNYTGVTVGVRLNNAFALTKVLIVLSFVVASLLALLAQPGVRVTPQDLPMTMGGWLSAVLLMIYSFAGFEAALFVTGEARNPRDDAPVALLLALFSATILYVGVQYVVIHGLPSAMNSSKPVADAAQRILGSTGGSLVAGGALVSAFGYLSANMLHTPRLTFAMAEQGDFPAFFGLVHPRFRTPFVSIVAFAVLVFSFSAAGNFKLNATLAAVSRIFVYASIAAALPVLRRKAPQADAFRVRGGIFFTVAALIFTCVLAFGIPASGWVFMLAASLLGLLNWLWARHKSQSSKEVLTSATPQSS